MQNETAQTITEREALLCEWSAAYYLGEPIVDDPTFDACWRLHESVRKQFPEWYPVDTILDRVEAPAPDSGFKKVTHRTPMLSITDVFEGEGDAQFTALRAFIDKLEKKLGPLAWPLKIEPKVDGIALAVTFSAGGDLQLAVTRGDGTTGDDITDNVRTAQLLPDRIDPNPEEVEIRGEVYVPLGPFQALNEERIANDEEPYKNPRNLAAGSIKLHDQEELAKRPLAFIRHDVEPFTYGSIPRIPAFVALDWETLLERIDAVKNGAWPFAVDGAVIKVARADARQILGFGTRAPEWACAFKFLPEQKRTTLEAIVGQVGRTGAITPVAMLTPVMIDGSLVSKATLHNADQINRLGLQVGDTVVVQKAGGIIPEIVESVQFRLTWDTLKEENPEADDATLRAHIRKHFRKDFSLITHLGGKCPSCGSTELGHAAPLTEEPEGSISRAGAELKLKVDKSKPAPVALRCFNPSCPAQLSTKVYHFASRKCLNIEGIGKEAAVAIAAHMQGIAEDDPSVFPSPFNMFDWIQPAFAGITWTTSKGGTMSIGAGKAGKIVRALVDTHQLPLRRWLWALGIPSIGENTSKELSRLWMSGSDIQSMVVQGHGWLFDIAQDTTGKVKQREDLKPMAISGHLGPVSCAALIRFCQSPYGQWCFNRMAEYGIKSDNYDPTPTASDDKPLFGKTFCITGTLSVGRDEMKALIGAAGGKVSGDVSKKTDFLVCGEGGGGKADKATKLGVKTLDEAAMRAML